MKLLVISVSLVTLCAAIRVPTSWTSSTDGRLQLTTHRRAPVELPQPLAVAHSKYARNKDSIRNTPHPNLLASPQVGNVPHSSVARPASRPDFVPVDKPQRYAHGPPVPGYGARPVSRPDISPVGNFRGHRIVHEPRGNVYELGNGRRNHQVNFAQPFSVPREPARGNVEAYRDLEGQRKPDQHHLTQKGNLNGQKISLKQKTLQEIQNEAGQRNAHARGEHERTPEDGRSVQDILNNQGFNQQNPTDKPFKPEYHFDSYFNPVQKNPEYKYFDQFKFFPQPKPVEDEEVHYQRRKEAIILKNHRDDKTHEPSNEGQEVEDERDDDESERENYENEKSDEGGEVESEEEEKAPISEHEEPAEVPTRPIYPGEGKWAQRGVHRPFISNHKYINLADADDDGKSNGHEVFDKVQDVFQRQSNRFANNLSSFPTKNKLGHYIQPSKEAERVQEDEEKDNEELNEAEEEEDEEFVPTQIYTQVRKTEDEEHLPPVYEGPHKLREVIKDSKIQTVYTEEGYEDVAYDHAGHEKEAAENEGFAEAEEEVEKEKLKKAPRLKYKHEPSDDSEIEESNIDHGKRIVSPNGDSIVGVENDKTKKKKKPAFNIKNNNHFMKTKEIKTTAVKDSEQGGKHMEILSEVKVMMVPDKDGKHMKKIVQITPKKSKKPKKYLPYTKKDTEQLNVNGDQQIFITSTLKPDPSDMISDSMPLPTTATEPLSKVTSKDHSKSPENEVLKPTVSSTKDSATMRINKFETKIRRKRFTNDFEKVQVDTAFIDDIDHTLPAKPVDRTPEKYPYYFDKRLQIAHSDSALRYSEDMKNIPPKRYGEMTFYDLAQESVPCEEVESDVNPVPERVENAEENAKEMKKSEDVAELAEAPRLKGLGDKIMCFKKRYFGENPLDSPFFKEDYIDPVTPPYNMLKFFPHQKAAVTSFTNHHPIDKSVAGSNANIAPLKKISEKPKPTNIPVKEVTENNEDHLSENASTLSEESSDAEPTHSAGFANEENEVNVDDPERILKENLTDLETFEDDYDTAAEVEEEPNERFMQNIKINEYPKTLSEQADKDGPTKFVLSLGKNNLDNHNKKQIPDSVIVKIEPTTRPEVVTQPVRVKVPDEVITLHPDAEFVDVEKLPEPTTTEPPLNIITTPKYTIDLVPKHIYDQIELLRFLPNQTESSTETGNVNNPQVAPEDQAINQELPKNLTILNISTTTNETNPDTEQNSRHPKVLVIDDAPPSEVTNENVDASDRSDEDQPESLPLRRNNRKKLRRKRPFVVFDVNRFWPTTPFPLFQQKVKLNSVKPKHDPNSEVRYKDEIKPSEQLTVLRDVLTIIRNSSLQDPLMVAESQGTRVERPLYNHGRVPIRPISHNTIPIYHPGPVPHNNQFNTHYNRFFLPTNLGPKPATPVQHTQVKLNRPEKEEELSTKLKNTAVTETENEDDEEDEISYYTSQDIEKVRPDEKVGSPGRDRSKQPVDQTYNPSHISQSDETNDKSSEEDVDQYQQEPITEVLGLVPPGNNHYSTIYNYKPHQQPVAFVIDESSLNKFYVEGMKPPPKNQKVTLYRDLKTNKPRRRIRKHHRSRRQVKPGYTELVRSRGPQFQSTESDKKTDDDDDYVPHRPRNYHYDEKTGKIIYDNVEKDEDDELEYAVVYEEVTEPPAKLKTTTVSWIATAKPNKDEKPLLFFVEQLKKHPDYKFIPDPTTTEKGKGGEQTTTSTTPVPVSTTPPPFLNILAKVKSDSNYKLIPDKTTAKTTTTEANEELEEAIEETKVENVEESANSDAAESEEEKLSDLIFDISQFLPKMRTYKPRTDIDYSKYKTIERPQVSTRHNLSSRYNAENEKELQEVNTKKIPLTLATEGDSMESQDVSESRIDEKTSEAVPTVQAASTTIRSRRRKISKNVKDTTASVTSSTTSTTTTTTTQSPLPSSSQTAETVTLFDDSLTTTSPATVQTASSQLTSTITRQTTTSTTQSPAKSKKVRIRGRVRATTPKATPEPKKTLSGADDEKKTPIRRRPQRVKSRTTTEKFFEPSDLESPAKTVQRRQSQSGYYDSEGVTRQVPYKFDPVLLGDATALTTTQRPTIRRRPRIRIQKNNVANERNDEVTTYRAPATQAPAKVERQPVRRRGRVNTRTRTRGNNNAAKEEATVQPVRYTQSAAREDTVTTAQPRLRGRSRLNRIQPARSFTPTFNPEAGLSQQSKITPLDIQSKTTSPIEAQQFNTASLYSSQPATAYTPTFSAYFTPDPTTPKSYTPINFQGDISSSTATQSKTNPEVKSVNIDNPSLNGLSYYSNGPSTPSSLKYRVTIDDSKPTSINPALVSNRRSDADISDIPLSHIPKDISTPQPFRYTAVIEDNLATTEAPRVSSPIRIGTIDSVGLNGASYFPLLSTTPQPFKYTATIPGHSLGVSRNTASVQGIPGFPNVSPSSDTTYFPSGSTTPISLDFSSIYSSNLKETNPPTLTSKLPPQLSSTQIANSDVSLSNVATYFNLDSSTQRLPYSAAPSQNFRTSPLPQQPTQDESQLTGNKNLGNINIPPPSDAYLDAYITTPLPSTIGRIIPGNVPRPTESPNVPIRRRGRIINRGDAAVTANDAAAVAQEPARGRGGNLRRRPQRTRARGTSPPPQQDADDAVLQVNIQPAVRQRVPSDHRPDQNVSPKVIDADARTDSEQNHSKKLNVEVYQTYNPSQRHGGNYREENEDSLVTDAVSSKKNEKIVLTPEGQTGNVNVGGIRTYSHRQAYLDSLKQGAGVLSTVQPPLVVRNTPVTVVPSQDTAKKANVEVYKSYDANQRHGGNYKEEGAFPDVVQSATINPLGGQTYPNTERIPPKKVNVETLKNIDPKHFEVYGQDVISEQGSSAPNPKLQRVVLAPETIQTQRANVEAFKEYDQNQRHGGNYRKEYDNTEVIESKLAGARNEKIIQSPEKVTPKTIHFEVFDSYNPKQRHGGNYRSEDESDIGGVTGENQKLVVEPDQNPTKKVKNVEVLKPYNTKQKHGGNYKSEDEDADDADYQESEIVNKGNGETALIGQPLQPQNVNIGLYGGDDRHRVPSVFMEPPEISLPALTGIPGDMDTGALNVEIFKPNLPAPRHRPTIEQDDDTDKIDRFNIELLKPHAPAPRTNQHEKATEKEKYKEEVTSPAPSTRTVPQRRRRPLHRTTTNQPDVNTNFRSRNTLRRRDPKSIRGSVVNVVQEAPARTVNPVASSNPRTDKEDQDAPTRSGDVDVFKDYDKKMRHGGNYRRINDDGNNRDPVGNSRKVLVEETTERLRANPRSKPLGLYNDPKLAKNINQLKEIRIPETVTEEIVRDVVEEEEADEDEKESEDEADYGWINIKAIGSSTPKSVTVVTTTKPDRVANVIKDPSKRLYFYAAV